MSWWRINWWRSRRAAEPAILATLAGLPEAAALLNSAGVVQAVNTPLRVALGPTQPVRPGWPAERIFASTLRAETAAWLAQPGAAPRELRLAAPQGMSETPVVARRILLPKGDSLLLLQDLTPRQVAAEADRLQTLGALAGGIAHDFNNLLTVVLGASEDAQRLAGSADPALVAELAQIRQAAGRGALLVKQLLAYARQQVLAPRLVPLNEVVESMASLLRGSGQRQGVVLEVVLDEPGRLVLIDPSQLDRVVMNLAMNARQAMPDGGRLRLSTGRLVLLSARPGVPDTVPPGRWTVLEVTDTGGGIPADLLPRIFEPFFTTRPDQGGTGLGLATVHGIVRQSGGFMVVESQPGQGTCFRILLPRVEEAATDIRPATPPAALPARHPSGPILLVDDEAPLRRLAERALRRAGHDVVVAEDAETALALLEEGLVPGHLISDVAMPGMDGVALARALRARLPGLPVLLVSGYAHAAVDGGLEEDGIRFLAKPYGPAELVAAVGEPVHAE